MTRDSNVHRLVNNFRDVDPRYLDLANESAHSSRKRTSCVRKPLMVLRIYGSKDIFKQIFSHKLAENMNTQLESEKQYSLKKSVSKMLHDFAAKNILSGIVFIVASKFPGHSQT